jgi:hypothetical protein
MTQKNFRSIPTRISSKVKQLPDRYLIVSCLKKYSATDISKGVLSHLGVSLDSKCLHLPTSIMPKPTQGKHSDRNINGQEIVRRDLGLLTLYHSVDVPNWGDSYNGTHSVDLPYKAYLRDFISPHLVQITMECPNTAAAASTYGILFKMDEVLDKKSADFDDRLFDLVNILQENISYCDVYPSKSGYQDYIKTLHLNWDILPPGQMASFIKSMGGGNGNNPQYNQIIQQRYDFLMSLTPVELLVGTSGFLKYCGAKINGNLVVFDNPKYGNAAYVMYDTWSDLSKKSRTELLSGRLGNNFDRIIHNKGWEKEVRSLIKKKTQSAKKQVP